MRLVANHDIAVKGQHCAAGTEFSADGADAKYLIGSGAAHKAPVQPPVPLTVEQDVAPDTLTGKKAEPVAEDRRKNPREKR